MGWLVRHADYGLETLSAMVVGECAVEDYGSLLVTVEDYGSSGERGFGLETLSAIVVGEITVALGLR